MDMVELDNVRDKCIKALQRGVFTVQDAKKLFVAEAMGNGFDAIDALNLFVKEVVTPVINGMNGVEG